MNITAATQRRLHLLWIVPAAVVIAPIIALGHLIVMWLAIPGEAASVWKGTPEYAPRDDEPTDAQRAFIHDITTGTRCAMCGEVLVDGHACEAETDALVEHLLAHLRGDEE